MVWAGKTPAVARSFQQGITAIRGAGEAGLEPHSMMDHGNGIKNREEILGYLCRKKKNMSAWIFPMGNCSNSSTGRTGLGATIHSGLWEWPQEQSGSFGIVVQKEPFSAGSFQQGIAAIQGVGRMGLGSTVCAGSWEWCQEQGGNFGMFLLGKSHLYLDHYSNPRGWRSRIGR